MSAVVSAASGPARVARLPAGQSIEVDGVLDESVWSHAEPVSDFRRYLPSPGPAHSSRTEVRFVQDDDNLYVGVRVSGASYPIRAHISPREDVNVDDQVGIYLDPMGEARTGYIFYVNAVGVQQDIRYAYGDWFMSWNTVFQSEGRVTDDGFEVEVAIPFRSLRYPRVEGEAGQAVQDWGVMLTRKIPAEGIKYSWPQLQPRHPRMFAQQARLTGVRPGSDGAGIEILPVVATRVGVDRGVDGLDALGWADEQRLPDVVRPGLDFRAGVAEDMGIAATLNPDFSQVEGDIRQIDLNQRFAFFYPERRPFFLDGVASFRDTNDTLYTRSIVAPLGGLKISGRTGPYNIGSLAALDARPQASVHQDGTPGFDEASLDGHWASNAFARARRDVMGNGFVGVTATDKRIVAGVGAESDIAKAHSNVLLTDVQLPLGEVWTVGGFGSVSNAGTVDELLQGAAGGLEVERSPAFGLGGELGLYDVGTGYRNEMGFLNQSGISSGFSEVFHRYRIGQDGSAGASGVASEAWRERDGDSYSAIGLMQDLRLVGNHEFEATALWREWSFQGADVAGPQVEVEYEGLFSRFFGAEITAGTGRELDFASLMPASATRLDTELNFRPSVATRLDLFYAQQWFRPEAQERSHLERFYGRLTWQLTKALGVRLIGQTQTGSEIVDPTTQGSVLMAWVKNPGTEAYVGSTWTVETDGRGLTEQMLFAKYTHLFRR